eukprot:COSAG06_NODE_5951_length_3189_cov_2.744743_4_plen_106_part_01
MIMNYKTIIIKQTAVSLKHPPLIDVLRKTYFFLSFPYVCPEPVLVKCPSFLRKRLKKYVLLTAMLGLLPLQENGSLFFECFPYVCPEPVLVKRSLSYIDGKKRPFS